MLCYDLMISGCCCSVPGRGIVLVTHHTLALDHGHNSSYAATPSPTPRPQNNVKLFHLRHAPESQDGDQTALCLVLTDPRSCAVM